ncbi:SDR family oxidoreductase [Geminicoccus roseus]|uniref:SDR family oxidoreductase n=1 Tax=Geminicoccus roseus TaxID=404900 RepID=UPI0004039A56|nr:SDR family oxidoreductase [Geminicoccus roseus]
MKIVVIGGNGLVGSRTVASLREAGHEVLAASPSTGVDILTGEGLPQALTGADVVVDVVNSPSFEPQAVLAFFETAGRNLAAAERAAGVRHHVALSIVGTDRMPDNAYFQAKVAQEKLVRDSATPFTIVRSTQFFEFLSSIADGSTSGGTVRLPGGLFQPIAVDDVAALLADAALAAPCNGIIEIAGPERMPFDEVMRRYLRYAGDPRLVERVPDARYFGGKVGEFSLVPLTEARLGQIDLETWFRSSASIA